MVCSGSGVPPTTTSSFPGSRVRPHSIYHLEITGDDGRYRVRDVGSTNGTFVDGEQISDAELHPPSVIRLGNNGPEFAVTTEYPETSELDRTLVIPAGIQLPAAPPQPRPASPRTAGTRACFSKPCGGRAGRARRAGATRR